MDFKELKNKYILVCGKSGVGKSSFIKKITKNNNIKVSGGGNSCTKECLIVESFLGFMLIDSQGINDTSNDSTES